MSRTLINKYRHIETFDLMPGRIIAKKYEVVSKLGSGWEGEVYKIRELNTNIERAAKLFFPGRNTRNKASNAYAKKLHTLRDCPIVIQYHTHETILYRKLPITVLISEYVEGDLLSDYLARFPGKRMHLFQGIHLLHALTAGLECIHHHGEYHGDLHPENIIVSRLGLTYELKLLDFFHWSRARRENMNDDLCDLIRIFYDALGGRARYSRQPKEVKEICCGLKRSLILKKFRNAGALRTHLENVVWS
ncbi:MAG: protein kinase [Nitrospiraceae bacterium]|nr:MAG: protein kinase [Nitrospiraceae bacterium]